MAGLITLRIGWADVAPPIPRGGPGPPSPEWPYHPRPKCLMCVVLFFPLHSYTVPVRF